MKELIERAFLKGNAEVTKRVLFFVTLVLLWPLLQRVVQGVDETAGYVDPGIWMLVLLALVCYLGLVGLSLWLVSGLIRFLGLPGLGSMVSRFKKLDVCVQLWFYVVCYALLLLAGVLVLMAVL
ncbi:hypothetical protein [Pedobacter sp. JY14-1]|uniref:hypothetical protein n=1 Tax=Pedobacter sp. JY14-1 TaxID=3034151 RepID=UPI0023E1243F|nr:hypothetical protein [Pedobacter sp. JY14-1]